MVSTTSARVVCQSAGWTLRTSSTPSPVMRAVSSTMARAMVHVVCLMGANVLCRSVPMS